MRPHPASIMSGTADCTQWKVPVRLTAMIRSHASTVRSVNFTKPSIPALVTRIPIGPNAPRERSIAASTAVRSLTSTATASARPPSASISFATRSAAVGVDVEDGHAVTLPGQAVADGLAHARTAARDHRRSSRLTHVASPPLAFSSMPSVQRKHAIP